MFICVYMCFCSLEDWLKIKIEIDFSLYCIDIYDDEDWINNTVDIKYSQHKHHNSRPLMKFLTIRKFLKQIKEVLKISTNINPEGLRTD